MYCLALLVIINSRSGSRTPHLGYANSDHELQIAVGVICSIRQHSISQKISTLTLFNDHFLNICLESEVNLLFFICLASLASLANVEHSKADR